MVLQLFQSKTTFSGSTSVKSEAEQMAVVWAGEDEEKLCWLSSISPAGRRHHVAQLRTEKAKIEKVLQFSASKPLDDDFVEFGLGEFMFRVNFIVSRHASNCSFTRKF